MRNQRSLAIPILVVLATVACDTRSRDDSARQGISNHDLVSPATAVAEPAVQRTGSAGAPNATTTLPGTPVPSSPPPAGRAGSHRAIGVAAANSRVTQPALPAGCQEQRSGGRITTACASDDSSSGVPLHLAMDRVLAKSAPIGGGPRVQSITVTTAISTSGEPVVQMKRKFTATTGAPPTESVTFTYGPAIHGLKSATLSQTGGTVSGSINGRAIVPFKGAAGVSLQTIKFVDHRPPPTVTVDATLQKAVTALLKKTQANPVEGGGIPSASTGTDQNTFDYFATPSCQGCES